ncbi:FprA family A-type flavoprotein [Desulfuribacillus alkaliarsenatis]|uniref:Flavodoxin n=1 Tax=Desulfuribacillus alkaliarsenatis TaxID=766136 RepID=A0A1E5G1F7_9FIRM|nr:FprA family A-type flavoprotein [Desulfuribacillus alkaliarsenatis]OEF96278.1 flavodoxin [Desulfuribacillus alkaliarsenatis]
MIAMTDSIYWVGVNDRETHLFESMLPIPQGVSYNAYMIVDEKVALIDTVKADYNDTYLDKIKSVIGNRDVDYLVINHIEPDHSGCIKSVVEAYPDVKIVGNKKTANFLEGFYGVTENVLIVKESETLNLGKHELTFFMTPMLHWPETMMTYEGSNKTLFSGDAFGGFGALNGGVFDNEVNFSFYEDEMRRYYANIVGRYSDMVQRALNKLSNIEVQTICSTHGIVWRDNPKQVIDLYDKWSKQEGEDGVVIAYGSMYGNTKAIAEQLARAFAELGIKDIKVYDAARTHMSYILSDIWRYNTVLLGSSTYNSKMFPPMESLLSKMENSKLKNKNIGVFGTYSWSGESVDLLQKLTEQCKIQLFEPTIKNIFAPGSETVDNCKALAKNLVAAMK